MSDAIRQRGQKLINDVVKDIKDRQPDLEKLKEMTRLAKEVNPDLDTADFDAMLEVAETVGKTIVERLGKIKPK